LSTSVLFCYTLGSLQLANEVFETTQKALGPGAIAAVVLGVLLGVSWLAAILVWWRIVRRKRLARAAASEMPTWPAELAQTATSGDPTKSQSQTTSPPQDTAAVELPHSIGQCEEPPMNFAELSVLQIPPTARVPVELHTMPPELT
jgi:hypothetical protein